MVKQNVDYRDLLILPFEVRARLNKVLRPAIKKTFTLVSKTAKKHLRKAITADNNQITQKRQKKRVQHRTYTGKTIPYRRMTATVYISDWKEPSALLTKRRALPMKVRSKGRRRYYAPRATSFGKRGGNVDDKKAFQPFAWKAGRKSDKSQGASKSKSRKPWMMIFRRKTSTRKPFENGGRGAKRLLSNSLATIMTQKSGIVNTAATAMFSRTTKVLNHEITVRLSRKFAGRVRRR